MSGGNGGSGGGGAPPFAGWPELAKAAYRGQQLQLNELHDGLFLLEDAFTTEECRAMIAAVEATGQMVSTNPRNLPPRKGHAFRNNERFLVRTMEGERCQRMDRSIQPNPSRSIDTSLA
jgi:hypothetical protein